MGLHLGLAIYNVLKIGFNTTTNLQRSLRCSLIQLSACRVVKLNVRLFNTFEFHFTSFGLDCFPLLTQFSHSLLLLFLFAFILIESRAS